MSIENKINELKNYFEKQGYIIRDGLKYGTDILLYTENPNNVHSRYAVLLYRKQTFQQIIAVQRVCNSCKKELIIALVENDIKLYKVERFCFHENILKNLQK